MPSLIYLNNAGNQHYRTLYVRLNEKQKKEGMETGMRLGMETGMRQGMQTKTVQVVLRLLDKGISPEETAENVRGKPAGSTEYL